MDDEIDFILDAAKEQMEQAVSHLEKELSTIRAGKANPTMLSTVKVDYYGAATPLNQVANVSATDPRTLTIQPWEKNMLHEIEKSIVNANLGFSPMNNGEMIIINVPVLTEERRKELSKQAKSEAERTKISIRNIRKDANQEIKKLQKNGLSEDIAKDVEADIQKLTDDFSQIIDQHYDRKEKEIMTV